ncbi:hypothetical protein [Mucilaginibacter myungsuensis]|uniref:MG2 domain-containing protein n=1 Tax=Mucilaginibacter myungsuensis TaxID=649104 RepID=A0A929KWR2_9SPHI|nr:hypothetical protein [Mucilaginibacter myungsuensis]MBE9662592.1 hypothetical protein [Mucilaginibacter myungsuensis]MDN3598012.1 hypothetical protein [Mucilaginibacter myungsuensis]
MSLRTIYLLAMLLVSISAAKAQDNYKDTVDQKIKWYSKKNASSVLFAHIDKTIYVNNETIWFAAYLLVPDSNLLKHQVISVGLVNNNTQKLVVEAKYPMRAFAHGNLLVPDTVAPGNYSFVAFTNLKVNGQPALRFIQPVTIKTPVQPPFTINVTLDTLYKDPLNTRLILTARDPNGLLEGAKLNFTLGKDKKTRFVAEAKTNVLGSHTLLIPKSYINNDQHNLEIQVKADRKVKTIHFDIPVKKQVNDVKFYPEGGRLVAGLTSRIGWEVKTPAGTPIRAAAILYADKRAVDTIETDSYGMGIFSLTPMPGKHYTAKLIRIKNDDAVYQLPPAMASGVTINMPNAIVDDTLKLGIKSAVAGKYILMIHNYSKIGASVTLNVNKVGNAIKLGLPNVARGLNTITVLDDKFRPAAERMFFAHYDKRSAVKIGVSDMQPGLRQLMTIKLRLDPGKTDATKALVSVAAVHDDRLAIKKENNIENYFYLQKNISDLPVKEHVMGRQALDKSYLNNLLLIRGWTKYNWPDMLNTVAADTVKTLDEVLFYGNIADPDQDHLSHKKLVGVNLFKDSSYVSKLKADINGDFKLSGSQIFAKRKDDRIWLTGDNNTVLYRIKLTDPFIGIQKEIAKNIEPGLFDPPVSKNTEEFVFAGLKRTTNLRTVVIKGAPKKSYGANDCGDYVCRFNILNCPNHPFESDNRPPVGGELIRDPGAGGLISYERCGIAINKEHMEADGMLIFRGVFNGKEHYGADYKKLDPLDDDFLSTVLWKHDIMLSTDSDTELSFYTSDITGKFRIVVQGVTDKDVVYSEAIFNVKKKEIAK